MSPRTGETPTLSVVVPTRDTRELTLRCLGAIRRGGAPAEIVVVDDGSGDGTADAIRETFPEARLLVHNAPAGFTVAANRGLTAARGTLLLLLNSDTEIDSEMLSRLIAAFAARPELAVAGAALRYPDGRPQWSGGVEPTALWLFSLASALPTALRRFGIYRRLRPLEGGRRAVEWVSGCALALRRELWESVGPLDESFELYAQDLDLCSRARDAGWEVAVLPECGVVHHHGATIGGLEGSLGSREHPERLWRDLLCWVDKHRGPSAARRGRRALRVGARLRLVARGLRGIFVPADRRAEWDRDSEALRSALRALEAA